MGQRQGPDDVRTDPGASRDDWIERLRRRAEALRDEEVARREAEEPETPTSDDPTAAPHSPDVPAPPAPAAETPVAEPPVAEPPVAERPVADEPSPGEPAPDATAPGESESSDDDASSPDPAALADAPAPAVAPREPEPAPPAAVAPRADPYAELATLTPGGPSAETDDLLTRWADGDADGGVDSPRINWSGLAGPLIVCAVIAAVVLGAIVVIDRSGDDADGTTGVRSEDAEAAELLAEDPPSLEDLTADVTIPPGPAEGLAVAETGVTIVEDRFDAAQREGTFAVVIQNPPDDWQAQGVQVRVVLVGTTGGGVFRR